MLSFLHRWDCCWQGQFDTDVKIGNYNHHDGEQLLYFFKKKVRIKTQDQVYSNTRVPTQVNKNQHKSDTSQHESTRVWHESTLVRHKSKMSQHESDTSQRESTQVKKCPRWVNMSQHKSDTSLTQVNLS